MVLTVAAMLVAILVATAVPAFAVSPNAKGPQNENAGAACRHEAPAFFCGG